jgi:hypothetical protein
MMVNLAIPYSKITSGPRSQQAVFYAPDQPDYLFEHAPVRIWCQPVNRPLGLDWSACRSVQIPSPE